MTRSSTTKQLRLPTTLFALHGKLRRLALLTLVAAGLGIAGSGPALADAGTNEAPLRSQPEPIAPFTPLELDEAELSEEAVDSCEDSCVSALQRCARRTGGSYTCILEYEQCIAAC